MGSDDMTAILATILQLELCILAACTLGYATQMGCGTFAWTAVTILVFLDWYSHLQIGPPDQRGIVRRKLR